MRVTLHLMCGPRGPWSDNTGPTPLARLQAVVLIEILNQDAAMRRRSLRRAANDSDNAHLKYSNTYFLVAAMFT